MEAHFHTRVFRLNGAMSRKLRVILARSVLSQYTRVTDGENNTLYNSLPKFIIEQ